MQRDPKLQIGVQEIWPRFAADTCGKVSLYHKKKSTRGLFHVDDGVTNIGLWLSPDWSMSCWYHYTPSRRRQLPRFNLKSLSKNSHNPSLLHVRSHASIWTVHEKTYTCQNEQMSRKPELVEIKGSCLRQEGGRRMTRGQRRKKRARQRWADM